MSDRLFEINHMRVGIPQGNMRSLLMTVSIVLLSCVLSVRAQVGGRGPDPVPAFTQDQGGGTNPTVTFDPSTSYLPTPPVGQTYQYTLIYDFGDGSALRTVGPGTPATVLVPQQYTYASSGLFTVTLEIDVTVINQANVTSAGPSGKTTGQVRSATVNYPPVATLLNNSSPATGVLPYQVNVDCSPSHDEDGYIIWAAIDWGDGSTDIVSTLPPSTSAIASLHSYYTPGQYTITLSVIDNGRIPPGARLQPTPLANDPSAALITIQALQRTLIDNGVLGGPVDPATGITIYNANKYLPILRQDFLQIQVTGNLLVVSGSFGLDFTKQGNDSFDGTFDLNVPVSGIAGAKVSVFLGTGPTSQILRQFTTDLNGNYFNNAQGLKFSINPRKHTMRFQVKSASLQQSFQISNATVINGFADVPVKIVISTPAGTTSLASKLRFVYNARAAARGAGKNPRSELVGN